MKEQAIHFEALIKKYTSRINPIVLETADSTNRVAGELAKKGADEGRCVFALSQSGGKGSKGRSFFSYEGGIYMSLILRPSFSAEDSLYITTCAAVAVSQAIDEQFGVHSSIKWVNDIYIYNNKVCGILTEGAIGEDCRLKYAVLGIGINVGTPKNGFPDDISGIAAAVCDREVTAEEKARLAASVCEKFFIHYNNIEKKSFLDEYRSRSMLDGRAVSFELDGELHTGTVIGIDDNARLLVDEGGSTVRLNAGDVSVKWG